MDYEDKSESVEAPRYIEDDIASLTQLDKQIETLLNERAERVNMIEKQHEMNRDRVKIRQNWYDAYVRGNDTKVSENEPVSRHF